jgi:hypothetical protein
MDYNNPKNARNFEDVSILAIEMVVANMFHFLIGIFIEKTLHITMPRYEQQH